MQVDKHIINQINEEHTAIVESYKHTIEHAIKAGELLTRVKNMCKHGEFLLIVNSKFAFSERTAYRYIKAYEHSDKIATLADLQEAYKLIESEEAKKKAAKEEDQRSKFAYRRKYNEKPDSWTRDDDYAWRKDQEAKVAQAERIAEFKQEMDNAQEAKKIEDAEIEHGWETLQNHLKSEEQKMEKLKELNITNQNGGILDLLGNYLAGLSTDNQRIEECHNIIKYCKSVSAKLQEVK